MISSEEQGEANIYAMDLMSRELVPLWKPTDPDSTPIARYRKHVNKKFNISLQNSQQLHRWSVTRPHDFWLDLWSYVGLVPALPPSVTKAYDDSKKLSDIPKFFEGVHINYTENVLTNRDPNGIALIGLREGSDPAGTKWTWAQLTEHVRRIRSALVRSGIQRGDRIAALMSNSPWTIAIFLAVASMGAVFSSISTEMGTEGCVSRLQQIEPKILFAENSAVYKGKRTSLQDKIAKTIESVGGSEKVLVVVVPVEEDGLGDKGETFGYVPLKSFLGRSSPSDALTYTRLPFSAPMVIVYSSGTSGPPKCIVHQQGIVIQLKKIALLHNSLSPRDVVFQYSSTSWILWNIMNGHLSVGATLICYDGSPLYPDAWEMLRVLQRHRVTYFGTSPRYLRELETLVGHGSRQNIDLSSLRMITTTGAPLTPDQFEWFYSKPSPFPSRVHLSSVAGGTEICTSWLASDPAGPVYAGEMQMLALGQDVDVGDAETAESIKHVCAFTFIEPFTYKKRSYLYTLL